MKTRTMVHLMNKRSTSLSNCRFVLAFIGFVLMIGPALSDTIYCICRTTLWFYDSDCNKEGNESVGACHYRVYDPYTQFCVVTSVQTEVCYWSNNQTYAPVTITDYECPCPCSDDNCYQISQYQSQMPWLTGHQCGFNLNCRL